MEETLQLKEKLVAGSLSKLQRKLLLRTSPIVMSDELRPPECGSVNKGGKTPVLFGLAGGFPLELVHWT